MYVAFKATQITVLFLLVMWVIVVKHILVLRVVVVNRKFKVHVMGLGLDYQGNVCAPLD